MSKQADAVRKILDILFEDYAAEVDLSKITNAKLHKGIIVDFWLEDINCVIEVHGEQHESAQAFGGDKIGALVKLNKQLDRDARLRSICEQRGINYVEIWYNEATTISSVYDKLSPFMEEE